MQRAYATTARAILPRMSAGTFAGLFFGPVSPLSSPSAFAAALGTLVLAVVGLLIALPITLAQDALYALPPAVLYLLAALAALSALNVAQNGRSYRHATPPPRGVATVDDLRTRVRSKAEFVALWQAAKPPSPEGYARMAFEGATLPLGACAPITSFITHRLFPGLGYGPWRGKVFDESGRAGLNRFGSGGDGGGGGGAPIVTRRPFSARIAPSEYDGRPALLLDYTVDGDPCHLWGTTLGMHDELRELSPGVLIGLGCFQSSGGMRNCAPFVLWPAAAEQAAARRKAR